MKLFNYLFKENPVFVLLLGLCSTLAVSTTFERSYMMGLVVLIILILSNFIVSLIKKHVNEEVRIPVYIMVIYGSINNFTSVFCERNSGIKN